ncbi:hypothetical protein HPB50_027883 [Hyalomma asiaticum]|nr:hypothetical protein HPB50_027883 [Hyalomma asiaticum]
MSMHLFDEVEYIKDWFSALAATVVPTCCHRALPANRRLVWKRGRADARCRLPTDVAGGRCQANLSRTSAGRHSRLPIISQTSAGRRRVPRSPPLGEPTRRRRRRRPLIVDEETQISAEEMRQNIQDSSAEPRRRDISHRTLPGLQSVEMLFRQPGRKLLSSRLLRPWQRIQTLPEPDDTEPLFAAAQPRAGLRSNASQSRRRSEFTFRIVCGTTELPLAREEGSLEAAREPTLQDTSTASAEGRVAGKTSLVPVMGEIPEEVPPVQTPGDEAHPVPEEQALLDIPEVTPAARM